ncbi:MAG TPA: twin-arginine translocase subunit TatC [Thermomicrobiales bacterium]|jgi:sec-independent protein translocase protein TatC
MKAQLPAPTAPARALDRARNVVRAPLAPVRAVKGALAQPPPDEPDVFEEMTLAEHLDELRSRIVKVCLGIGGAFVIGIILAGRALDLVRHQTGVQKFDINDATENITDYFKIALYIAFMIAFPLIFYQAFAFIAPGLTRKEKRLVYTSLPFSAVLFLAGACFAFFFAIPRAFRFLSGFKSNTFDYSPTFGSIASFYIQVTIGMGLAFQTPIVMYLLARIGLLSARRFGKMRRYAFIVVLVAAAIITPTPDPFNMMVVAVPIYCLYELGILFARIGERRRERAAAVGDV